MCLRWCWADLDRRICIFLNMVPCNGFVKSQQASLLLDIILPLIVRDKEVLYV